MRFKIITPRVASTVLPLAQLKAQCRVSVTLEDDLLTAKIAAALQFAQHYTQRAIGAQVVELALDAFPAGAIELPLTPATGVTSVKYVDPNGTTQTLSPTGYALDDYGPTQWVVPAYGTSWPSVLGSANGVLVRYAAGVDTLDDSVQAGVLLLAAHLAENREGSSAVEVHEVPLGIRSLLDTYRDWGS